MSAACAGDAAGLTAGRELMLTGATGFVGMEVLARYLERSDRRVVVLVRAPSAGAARARMDAVLATLFGARAPEYRERIECVPAELTAPRMGLDAARLDELATRVGMVIHAAASVSFTLPLARARAINVSGTRRMLEFAELASERGVLERYVHISTAYVAGTHSGLFHERELDVGQRFRNSYERSKFEAEQLVRGRHGIPFTIVRPSIVVGDRRTGWTAAFNVLYWPLRALALGLFEAVPAAPTSPVDVVSIDYVADAIYELCESGDAAGATYHLTAGAHASTMGEIVGFASRYFRRPGPRLVPPAEFAAVERRSATELALQGGRIYFPYFSIGTRFDNEGARARLEPAGISVSPLREYLGRLLDFATRSRWGKRPIPRTEALVR